MFDMVTMVADCAASLIRCEFSSILSKRLFKRRYRRMVSVSERVRSRGSILRLCNNSDRTGHCMRIIALLAKDSLIDDARVNCLSSLAFVSESFLRTGRG